MKGTCSTAVVGAFALFTRFSTPAFRPFRIVVVITASKESSHELTHVKKEAHTKNESISSVEESNC